MNSDRIAGNWRQLKGKLKEEWGKLRENGLDVIDGRREQVSGKEQESFGRALDVARKEVDEFLLTPVNPARGREAMASVIPEGAGERSRNV